MINSVSFCGAQAQAPASQKKSTKVGTRLGAAAGAAYGTFNLVKNRGVIKEFINGAVESGIGKNKVVASAAVGAAIAIAALAGVGALLGKGVNAIVNHFKGDKASKAEEVA